ncbi:MAG TPA: FliH/SctL family protein [Negativicutes bacterium]
MSSIKKYVLVGQEPVVINTQTIAVSMSLSAADDDEVNDCLQQAKKQAEILISQAQVTAEQCITTAKQQAELQAEQVRQQAYDLAYQKGYSEGVSQGKQAGLQEMQQTIQTATEQAKHLLALAQRESQEMVLAAEHQIIDIVLAVVSKILARETAEDSLVVVPIAKAALAKVHDQEQIVIRVAPNDYEALLQAKQELQMVVGSEQMLSITPDSTITHGGCVIETTFGTVDAKLDTQFEMVKKALLEVAP